jgi:hypothetical protein
MADFAKWIPVGPAWAQGCEHCEYGIVSAPDVRCAPLYLARAILAHHGHVVFCDCRAGEAAQRQAAATWRGIVSRGEHLHGATVAAILAEAVRMPTVHGPEPLRA